MAPLNQSAMHVISGFRREVGDTCPLLVITQGVVVIYRCFGANYRSHLKGSSRNVGLNLPLLAS
jgi:hypothetical protein